MSPTCDGVNPPVLGAPLYFLAHLPCLSDLTSACHSLPLWAVPHCDWDGRSFLWLVIHLTRDFPYYAVQEGHVLKYVVTQASPPPIYKETKG